MPTYDYVCDDCGYSFEMFQGMLEKKLERCPECAGKVRRLIGTGAGIVFKGSGFYETDYRSDDYRKKAKSEKGGDEKPAGASKSEKSSSSSSEGEAAPKKATGSKPTPDA